MELLPEDKERLIRYIDFMDGFDIIFVLDGVKQKAREPLNFVDKIEEMFLVSNNRTINKERGKK